jgi:nucleoside-diphosphate-sugar epimerase
MNVLILGGTGFLGTHLIPKLKTRDHNLYVLTRNMDRIIKLEEEGITGIRGDILTPDSWYASLPNLDAIVFMIMPAIQPGKRLRSAEFKELQAQTTRSFQHALELARTKNCVIILTAGANYHTGSDTWVDETTPIQRFGMARLGLETDALIEEALNTTNPRTILMMPGQIYGPGGLFKSHMFKWIKEGKYAIIGSGTNHIPRIHVDDCAQAYVHALERLPIGERFILADDTPCTVNEFTTYMAEGLHIPTPRHIPAFMVRLVKGRLIYETVTMDAKVRNRKAKEMLDWHLTYPDYKTGLDATLAML